MLLNVTKMWCLALFVVSVVGHVARESSNMVWLLNHVRKLEEELRLLENKVKVDNCLQSISQ